MKNTVFKGMATALITPMTPDGRIDYAAMERLVQRQLDADEVAEIRRMMEGN